MKNTLIIAPWEASIDLTAWPVFIQNVVLLSKNTAPRASSLPSAATFFFPSILAERNPAS
jgi:hypothetical protein